MLEVYKFFEQIDVVVVTFNAHTPGVIKTMGCY